MNGLLMGLGDGDGSDSVVESASKWSDKIWDWLSNADMWEHVLFASIRILLIFIISRVIVKIVYRVIDHSLARRENSRLNMNPRRMVTVGELLKNMTSITSNLIVFMLVMGEFGFNLAPLLAGAGVLGLAIGFGAQSLVKDVITGFFVILEDQFAVGDVIQTGTLKGTVEMIGLRSTRLLSWTGEVHIIPNGLITNVTNYSIGNALAVVDLPFSNTMKLEHCVALLRDAMSKLKKDNEAIEEIPNVLGIQSLSASEFIIRIVGSCVPGTKSELERLIYANAKEALERADLDMLTGAKG